MSTSQWNPSFVSRPSKPQHMPAVRNRIVELPPNPFKAEVVEAGLTDDQKMVLMLWSSVIDTCRRADLTWVSAELCELISAAWDTVPDDTELDHSMLPFACALVGFGSAMPFTEHQDHEALLWSVSDAGVSCVIGDWAFWPMGVGPMNWRFGQTIAEAEQAWRDAYNNQAPNALRVLAAFALLLTQEGVTEATADGIDRATARRLQRAGSIVPPVRVVRIRGERHSGGAASSAGHHLTKRFIVRGHWRNQAHGPNRSLRRPTWISPHIKGPEHAPLDARPTVYLATATAGEA